MDRIRIGATGIAGGIGAGVFATCLLVGALLSTVVATTAFASHDDSTLVGLRVSVTDISGNDVTVEVAGQGYDSDDLPSARLGTQFFYDHDSSSYLNQWTNAPPALDWGDGSTIQAIGVPFTGYNVTFSSPYSVSGNRTFSSEFMHTYSSPGSYTVRAFGTNVYAGFYAPSTLPSYVLSGNIFSVVSPGIIYSSGAYTNTTYRTGNFAIGLTATTQVNLGSGGGLNGPSVGPGSPPSGTSNVRNGDCGLIGIELLAVAPVWALARRRRRAGLA